MRRQTLPKAYLLILGTLLLLMSAPKSGSERMRGMTVSALSPAWELLYSCKQLLAFSAPSLGVKEPEELQKLRLENGALEEEVHKYKELFRHELRLLTQFAQARPKLMDEHRKTLLSLAELQMKAMPARVIFRSPASWSSSVWINVGEADDKEAVRKNSPVVVGRSLVGVVDYVGSHQSRVRLITDSGLTPSVRAARGWRQELQLGQQLQMLESSLAARQELFSDSEERRRFLEQLRQLKERIEGEREGWLLAKGELHGSSAPLWRSHGQKLTGTGFNYDFSDDEGPARDLRTGQPIHAPEAVPALPILQVHDLLVTTGLDGVFPAGLEVATVTKIEKLKEGDYFYELEALPTAGDLNELSLVFVMPPVGYSPSDQPPLITR